MAFLINRTAAARIECLHALAQLILSKFGQNTFTLNDVKFDRTTENIHKYCTLLQYNDVIGTLCRFKDNPLDEAGCAITNGVTSDSTKSKEVSNTINALNALDFAHRSGRFIRLTNSGVVFAQTDYLSPGMTDIIRNAVLNYGPITGIITSLSSRYKVGDRFSTSDISVGYPNTDEFVEYNGHTIRISSGSRQDSNTRTKSCLLAWLVTAGYIKPVNIQIDNNVHTHLAFSAYINSAHRNAKKYEILELPEIISTHKPLDYKNLTKLNRGLRERGMADIREATMLYESIINNRRFAIIYLLNKAHDTNQLLRFSDIIRLFRKYPQNFIISDNDLDSVVQTEIAIAHMAGIPYDTTQQDDDIYLKPHHGINMAEAAIDVPNNLMQILTDFILND